MPFSWQRLQNLIQQSAVIKQVRKYLDNITMHGFAV